MQISQVGCSIRHKADLYSPPDPPVHPSTLRLNQPLFFVSWTNLQALFFIHFFMKVMNFAEKHKCGQLKQHVFKKKFQKISQN
jgi:hypothetical protein